IAILPKIAERQGLRVGVSLEAATPGGFVYYVVANLLAGGASVTPGLDGSYMWMLTGIFEPVMAAIGSVTELRSALSAGGLGAALQSVHWVVLVATGVGAVVGIFFVSKLIDTAIKRWPSVTYYVILGLVAASIYGLWPASHGYGESASTTVWPVGVAVNPLDIVVVLIAFAVGVAITLYSGSRGEPEAGAARSVSEHAA
ncbi:MAG: DUF368 domain-containing protein, partial [Chloroflexi bacterium]|nr:DUF368 domain-containing protein [Chloroflexota bacterium]